MGRITSKSGLPEHLQEAVAHVLDADAPRRVLLKKSLGTKNLKEAKAAAPHIVADSTASLEKLKRSSRNGSSLPR